MEVSDFIEHHIGKETKLAELINKAVTSEFPRNINCHKFILYLLEKISYEDLISDSKEKIAIDPVFDFTFGKKCLAISDKEFVPVANAQELHELAEKECESGKLYIGQILDAEDAELAHSFIVGKEPEAGRFICLSKMGFKHYPFQVHELSDLLDFINEKGEMSYQNQKWRFIPIDQIN